MSKIIFIFSLSHYDIKNIQQQAMDEILMLSVSCILN